MLGALGQGEGEASLSVGEYTPLRGNSTQRTDAPSIGSLFSEARIRPVTETCFF